MENKIITLTTDFGCRDHYVATMKGVILSINPGALIVDITHLIPQGDIASAAFTLCNACGFFPEGTIHMAVVDPGVGGARVPIIIDTKHFTLVGPDNGIFTRLLATEEIVRTIEIKDTAYMADKISNTFHGRDIFAPVSARLSLGADSTAFGPPLKEITKLGLVRAEVRGSAITGEIIHIDAFGNLITNIGRKDIDSLGRATALIITIKGIDIKGVFDTYNCARASGELIALIGSTNLLEIAVYMGSAQDALDIIGGERVEVKTNT